MAEKLKEAKEAIVKAYGKVRDFAIAKITAGWKKHGPAIMHGLKVAKDNFMKFYNFYRKVDPRVALAHEVGMKIVNGVVHLYNSPAGQAAKKKVMEGLNHAKWAAQNPKAALDHMNNKAKEELQKAKERMAWARENPKEAAKLAAQKLQQGWDFAAHHGGKAFNKFAGPKIEEMKAAFNKHKETVEKHAQALKEAAAKKAQELKDAIAEKARQLLGEERARQLKEAAERKAAELRRIAEEKARQIREHAEWLRRQAAEKARRAAEHARWLRDEAARKARQAFGGFGRRNLEQFSRRHMMEMDAEEFLSVVQFAGEGYVMDMRPREEQLAEVEEFLSEQREFHEQALQMEEPLSQEEQLAMEEVYIDAIMEVADHHAMKEAEEAAEFEEELAEEEPWFEPEDELSLEDDVSVEELVAELMAELEMED